MNMNFFHRKAFIATVALLLLPLNLLAQNALLTEKFFSDKHIVRDKRVVAVNFKGDIFRNDHYGVYRSLTIDLPHDAVASIAQAVQADSRYAQNKTTVSRGDETIMQILTFPPRKGKKLPRELIFKKTARKAYLIYLEAREKDLGKVLPKK